MKEKERSENSIDATMLVVITPRYRLFVPFSAMIFTLKLTISSSPTPTSPADLSPHLPNGGHGHLVPKPACVGYLFCLFIFTLGLCGAKSFEVVALVFLRIPRMKLQRVCNGRVLGK